jgi:hypothetical protein
MALKGYLTKDSYSIVDDVSYSKNSGYLRFTLRIYSDASKQIELANKFYEISKYMTHWGIKGTTDTPPLQVELDDSYIIPKSSSPTGEWENRNGLIAKYEENGWVFWNTSPYGIYYDIASASYFKLDAEFERVTVYPLDDSRQWDKWFRGDLVFSSKTNISKQIYDFLRTFPGFETAVDC